MVSEVLDPGFSVAPWCKAPAEQSICVLDMAAEEVVTGIVDSSERSCMHHIGFGLCKPPNPHQTLEASGVS